MKAVMNFIMKGVIFVIIIGMLLHSIDGVLMHKGRDWNLWSAPASRYGFYDLYRNSTDVLFVGSSHSFYNFCPQVLYDEYSLRSYNLGTPGQTVIDSYYALKDALEYQNPKIVIFETYLFTVDNTEKRHDGAHRRVIDYMHWSQTKMEAIKDISEKAQSLEVDSFYLTNLQYHDRWKEVKMADFVDGFYRSHTHLKGYLPIWPHFNEDYQPFEVDESMEAHEISDLVEEYVAKMAELCKKKNIQLMLVKTPSRGWGSSEYLAIKKIAEELDILYYDFNRSDIYKQLDFEYGMDMSGGAHCNVRGAAKLSKQIGKVLTEELGISGMYDEQWEESKEYYEKIVKTFNLREIYEIDEYLDALENTSYTLLVSVKENGKDLQALTRFKMKKLGLLESGKPKAKEGYVAMVQDGEVIFEETSPAKAEIGTALENGAISIHVESSINENISCIYIADYNGRVDYSCNRKGYNIVVYDEKDMFVVDSISFDPSNGNTKISHR